MVFFLAERRMQREGKEGAAPLIPLGMSLENWATPKWDCPGPAAATGRDQIWEGSDGNGEENSGLAAFGANVWKDKCMETKGGRG